MKWLALVFLLLLPYPAWASYTQISWTWTQGAGGPVTGFHVKCGRTTTSYSISIDVADPDARSISVYTPTSNQRGQWFCTVDAYHSTNGTSSNGNEINFLLPQLGQDSSTFGGPGSGFGF